MEDGLIQSFNLQVLLRGMRASTSCSAPQSHHCVHYTLRGTVRRRRLTPLYKVRNSVNVRAFWLGRVGCECARA